MAVLIKNSTMAINEAVPPSINALTEYDSIDEAEGKSNESVPPRISDSINALTDYDSID